MFQSDSMSDDTVSRIQYPWNFWIIINNNNLMLISRKFTFIYDQMRVTTVEIKITLYE